MLCQTKAFFQSIQVARGSHIKHRGQFPELGSPFLREVKRCNTVTIYTTNSRPCLGPHSIPGLTSTPRCALLRLPSLLMSPLAANATCCLLKHSRVMSGTMEYQMAGIQGREVRIEACRHKKSTEATGRACSKPLLTLLVKVPESGLCLSQDLHCCDETP